MTGDNGSTGTTRRDMLRGGAIGVGAIVGGMALAHEGTADAAPTATVATEFFLVIAGIKGPSTVKGHQGSFPVTAYNFGFTSPRDAASGQATGPIQASVIDLTTPSSVASPLLVSALVTNAPLKSVTIVGVGGAQRAVIETITLTRAALTGFHQAATGGGALVDELRFDYQKIEYRAGANVVAWSAVNKV